MDQALQERFLERWAKYFPNAELPLAFYYTDHPGEAEPPREHHCFIAQLADARQGRSLRFNADSVVCSGGKRYLGFSQEIIQIRVLLSAASLARWRASGTRNHRRS